MAIAYERFDWRQIGLLAPDDEPNLSTDLSNWFVDSMSKAQEYFLSN